MATRATDGAPAAELSGSDGFFRHSTYASSVSGRGWFSRQVLAVGVLVGAVAVPLVVALVVLRDPRWLPVADVAQTEMLVRDVGQGHPPLVGLGGRMRGYGALGNHPGPLSFYALAPVYWLFGSDGWALLVAAATLVVVAAGLAVWIGHRRGGWPLALAMTSVVLLLLRVYGVARLLEPWNPQLPLMWWPVFLLAAWSVLCRDYRLLPVAVFAGSYCAQTHVSYLAPVGGLGLLVAAVIVWRLWAERAVPAERRVPLRLLAGSGGLAALLWLPPLLQQVRNRPGNLMVIIENFRKHGDEQIAFGDAFERWLARLDVGSLVTADVDGYDLGAGGSVGLGLLLLLGAWAATAVVAWQRRDRVLIRLHLTVGAALVLGLLAITRIIGLAFPYLMLWAWGTSSLVVLAVVCTLLCSDDSEEVSSARGASRTPSPAVAVLRWPRRTVPVLGVVTVVLFVAVVAEAVSVELRDASRSLALGEMSALVADRLAEDPVGCGDECVYLVTSTDAQAYGMLLELEKRGFDTRVGPAVENSVGDHRVVDPAEADAVVHLTGTAEATEAALEEDQGEQLAYVDHDDGYEPSAVFLLTL